MSQRKALERTDGGMGERPALIVVDVVVGFTDPACPLGSEADSVVAANIQLMNAFHRANCPSCSPPLSITMRSRPRSSVPASRP